jgi:ComF family protein
VRCERCSLSLPFASAPCRDCLAHPPAFDRALALGVYLATATHLNPLARALRALKYQGRRLVARSLGTAMAERFVLPDGALLVPVPLHPRRLRERGFNQAALLASVLAHASGRPADLRALARRRDTPSQTRLDASSRTRNLQGAFVARTRLDGRPVVLVDDIVTTGATASACAAALRAAGAGLVVVAAVGRAP